MGDENEHDVPDWTTERCAAAPVTDDGALSATQMAADSDCLCGAKAEVLSAAELGRACIREVIDKWMGPAGQDHSVTRIGLARSYKPPVTSCGDVLHYILERWGCTDWNTWFMIPESDVYDPNGATAPRPGDVFILCRNRKRLDRQHVGFFYEVTGSGSSLRWRSAEGGKGTFADQRMGISNSFRGPDDEKDRMLYGWCRLETLHRNLGQCRKWNKGKK